MGTELGELAYIPVLHYVALYRGTAMLQLFLQHQDCYINVQDKAGYTALMSVCRFGKCNVNQGISTLKLLLKQPDLDLKIKKITKDRQLLNCL